MYQTDPKKLIKALQTGRRKLGMTDEEYRGLLSSVTNGRTASSKELTGEELSRALANLRKAGFRTTGDPQLRKIKSLWYEMHDLGIVRNRSEQAIETYIRRITKVQKIEWCSVHELQLVIETLKNWIDRIEEPATREHLQHFFNEQEPVTPVIQ